MPATSKSQQRLMGQAYAYKKGELDSKEVSSEIKELADSMTLKQLKDFASTKHEGLPEVVEEGVIKIDLKKTLSKISNAIGWKHDPKMRQELLIAFEEDLRSIMLKHNYLVEDSIPENITPANLTGMGPVVLPANGTLGSGDVPAGQGDAEEEYKKSKKRNKKMKEIYTSFESFINESLAEAKLSVIHKAAKKGSYPASIVVIKDGKVIAQELVNTPAEVPAAFNVIQSYHKHKGATVHVESKTGQILFTESIVNEMDSEGIQSLADELSAEVYTARLKNGAKSASIKATTTNKTWDDGAPVLKYLARGKAKDMPFTLYQRPFTVLHDVAHGWFYFTDGRKWYGLHGDDGYDEPEDLPFDMEISESVVTESVFTFKTDNIEQLHFETDPKTAEEMKIELGKKQGEVSKRKQIESGEYSLRRFRKKIGYGNGEDVGVFIPGSYDASVSKLGDGPHKKAVKAIKWNQKKYDQWLEDMASNGGAENAFDMAQNAKNERGLIDWVKKNFRGDDPMQRIQWDIEAFA
ncbi:DUF3008 family protein [bacterium]|nr:DUF3008 family protein [bacterium]